MRFKEAKHLRCSHFYPCDAVTIRTEPVRRLYFHQGPSTHRGWAPSNRLLNKSMDMRIPQVPLRASIEHSWISSVPVNEQSIGCGE